MSKLNPADSGPPRWQLIWYALVTVLAVFTYFYGLDSDHIPRNGDEFPYTHITRLTAASGHLLPLQSNLPEMRNTKPPLLFWQGIASTDWGKNWTLWHLRYPSVIYTLLTAGLVFLLGWKLSRQPGTGFLALLTFLAFFSTYRYGRPFLTDPPEVFWLFLPCAVLLYWRPGAFESRWRLPILLGVVVGIGLLYKSFALLVPVTFALVWWFLRQRGYRVKSFFAKDAWKIAVMGIIALAIFSLWFVLDPNPQAILKEFVLKENAGKFNSHGGSYLANFFWGGQSIWRIVTAYPLNAGLLVFPVTALFFLAYQRRAQLDDAEKILWIWVFTLFFVFSLPSQRDERYVLPAMPALAVLCALNWERIHRHVFVASLVVTGGAVALLAYLSVRLQLGVPGNPIYPVTHWLLLAGTATIVFAALLIPKFTRPGVNAAAILALLCFAAFFRPFDGALGNYRPEVQQFARGREVWVPINFIAKEEGHRFFLPGADVHGYRSELNLTVAQLASLHSLFVIRLPMNATNPPGVKVIGQRLDLGSRHTPVQIKEMLRGKIYENLFLKEVLIEVPPGEIQR